MNAKQNESKSAASFTPGPWEIKHAESGGDVAVVYCISRGYVNICGADDRPFSSPIHDANARLIAESPNLYSLLMRARQEIVDSVGEPPMLDDDWEGAHGLISEIDEAITRINTAWEGGVA